MSSVVGAGLGHRFNEGSWLFRDLDFRLDQGALVGVVGPSGSGKSTLLSILAGWLAPTQGRVESTDVGRIGWVFQNPHGVARRSVLDHVSLPILARGLTRERANCQALNHLEEFGLGDLHARLFRELSGGEAQRLMLARAVATRPDLLLVDEPTAQLDRTAADTVNAVLARLASDDLIVVVATHDPHTQAACASVIDLAEYPGGGHGLDVGP